MPTPPPLASILATARKRIAQAGKKGLNEQDTKATLIEPVLRALGWDTESVDEVQREYRVKRQHKPVDYGLLANRTPRRTHGWARPVGTSEAASPPAGTSVEMAAMTPAEVRLNRATSVWSSAPRWARASSVSLGP